MKLFTAYRTVLDVSKAMDKVWSLSDMEMHIKKS